MRRHLKQRDANKLTETTDTENSTTESDDSAEETADDDADAIADLAGSEEIEERADETTIDPAECATRNAMSGIGVENVDNSTVAHYAVVGDITFVISVNASDADITHVLQKTVDKF